MSVTAPDLEDFLVRTFKWRKGKSVAGTGSGKAADGAVSIAWPQGRAPSGGWSSTPGAPWAGT